jgi:EAL domain-containing protein (putative c-di-GMP-specific phosphodiesterase class I)
MNNRKISPLSLIELIESKRYGVEYQPIVDLKSKDIMAYECLARFTDKDNNNIAPDIIYAALHDSPLSLFQVEYQQKLLQLDYAPPKSDIFVNLDQDSYFSTDEDNEKNPFLKLFKSFKSANIVVELIENSEINDAIKSLAMIDTLSKSNINTAIDDVCNPLSMISTSVIQLVDYIKLDKHVVAEKNNAGFMLLVEALISYAHNAGKKVILEGIETENDIIFARKINADYVQGFIFKKWFHYYK